MAAVRSIFNLEGMPELARVVAAPDFRFADLGGDSIDGTDFCFHVEEALDVEIEISDLEDYPTFSSFVAMLDQRLSERG
jgi:acyl carrier protein